MIQLRVRKVLKAVWACGLLYRKLIQKVSKEAIFLAIISIQFL